MFQVSTWVPFQVSQVKTKVRETDETVHVRIPEAYVWLLVPEQERGADGSFDAQGKVTLEIQAEAPDGVSDSVVRTVTENCRTLKFTTSGFEED